MTESYMQKVNLLLHNTSTAFHMHNISSGLDIFVFSYPAPLYFSVGKCPLSIDAYEKNLHASHSSPIEGQTS